MLPSPSPSTTIFYSTHSLCPKCLLLDKTGIRWKPAVVFRRGSSVFLSCTCDVHGVHETHYCSSVDFFQRMMSYSGDDDDTIIDDIEDLTTLSMRFPSSPPLIASVSLFRNDCFTSNERLCQLVSRIQPSPSIIKLRGGLAKDMATLNEKATLVVDSAPPRTPILMEVTFERFVALCELEESIFLRGTVYPALKYFIRPGDEEQCLTDIRRLIAYASQFKGIRLMITLGVYRPYADFTEILSLLRSEASMVRAIVFSQERTVEKIVGQAKKEDNNMGDDDGEGQRDDDDDDDVWDDSSTTTTTIPSGRTFHHSITTHDVRDIRWRFNVRDRDVKFSIHHHIDDDDDAVLVVDVSSKRCSGSTQGLLRDATPGVYTFTWDNSYSRMRKKVIEWSVHAVMPHHHHHVPDDSLDPYELLVSIESSTSSTIRASDFHPFSLGRLLEPFLDLMGYGRFSIRPSPFCALATILINHHQDDPATPPSVPITHFIDVDQFYREALPILLKWKDGSVVRNLKSANALRKLVHRHSKRPIPDILSYLTDPKKAEETSKFLSQVQLVLVHNNMDVAAVDRVRRCKCASISLSSSKAAAAGEAASCLGCV